MIISVPTILQDGLKLLIAQKQSSIVASLKITL